MDICMFKTVDRETEFFCFIVHLSWQITKNFWNVLVSVDNEKQLECHKTIISCTQTQISYQLPFAKKFVPSGHRLPSVIMTLQLGSS